MKSSIKILGAILLIGFFSMSVTSCSNMRLSSNAGVNVNFGPGGPHVDPYFNVGLHSSGGRYY